MDVQYSVKVDNRFFLDMDMVGDPLEILPSEKKTQKKDKKKKSEAKKKAEGEKKEPEPELKPKKEGKSHRK